MLAKVCFITKKFWNWIQTEYRITISTKRNPSFSGCGTSSSCSIPIQYVSRSGSHYDKYTSWSAGDTALDWSGAERGQGSYRGQSANGSPMFWSTNSPGSPGYVADNRSAHCYLHLSFWWWCKCRLAGLRHQHRHAKKEIPVTVTPIRSLACCTSQ